MHQSIPAAPIPPPPRCNCGAFACLASPGGGISKFGTARGSGICSVPRAFDTHVEYYWLESPNMEDFYLAKDRAVRRRIGSSVKDWTSLWRFSRFYDISSLPYQGTTITLYSEIGNDQPESTYVCFFEQGFKQNLVAMILNTTVRSIIEF